MIYKSLFLYLLLIVVTQSSSSSEGTSVASSETSGQSEDTATTTSPNTSNLNITLNSNLCSCIDIELVCDPVEQQNQTCYTYRIFQLSNASCSGDPTALSLNSDSCNITNGASLITNYAPSCFNAFASTSSASLTSLSGSSSPVITLTVESDSSTILSDTMSSDASVDSDSSDISGSSTSASAPVADSLLTGDFGIFSFCFDSSVSGTQSNGTIDITLGGTSASCTVEDIVPDFCSATTTGIPFRMGEDVHIYDPLQENEDELDLSKPLSQKEWSAVGVCVGVGSLVWLAIGVEFVRRKRKAKNDMQMVSNTEWHEEEVEDQEEDGGIDMPDVIEMETFAKIVAKERLTDENDWFAEAFE